MSYLNMVSLQKGSYVFDIPFDRQQLANHMNLERSALSKELGKMQRDGLITVEKITLRSAHFNSQRISDSEGSVPPKKQRPSASVFLRINATSGFRNLLQSLILLLIVMTITLLREAHYPALLSAPEDMQTVGSLPACEA